MKKEIRFIVNGRIYGKGRPRFSTISGFAKIYTPRTTKKYEEEILDAFIEQIGEIEPISINRAIEIEIKAEYSTYKRFSKKVCNKLIDIENMQGYPIPYLKTPDIDNIEKVVLDALNKVVYEDDRSICKISCEKYYSGSIKEDRLVITIKY